MNSKRLDLVENTQGLIRKDLLLDYNMATQPASKWENLTCYCKKQRDVPSEPFGYLTTLKDSVKYVTFLRKCQTCGKLRGNFEVSKPKPETEGVTL